MRLPLPTPSGQPVLAYPSPTYLVGLSIINYQLSISTVAVVQLDNLT
jgi:hypothetical protein